MTARLIPDPRGCGRRAAQWTWDDGKPYGCWVGQKFIPCPSPDEFPEGCQLQAAPSKPRVTREQVRDIVEYVIAAHGWDEHEQIISKVAEDLRAAGVEVVDE